MNHRPSDIVLADVLFFESGGSKRRPVIVAIDTGDDDLVAVPVTTRARHDHFDLPIADWRGAGLKAASTARLHKMMTLSKTDIIQPLGRLQAADLERFLDLLCRTYCHRAM